MTLDYSSAARATSPAARKVILIAGLVAATAAAVVVMRPHGDDAVVAAATVASGDATVTAMPSPNPDVAAANVPMPPDAYDDIVQSAVHDALTAPSQPAEATNSEWITAKVKRGQTLSTIFDTNGLGPAEWHSVLALGGDTRELRRLQIGDHLRLRIHNGQLQALTYAYDDNHTLDVRRVGDKLRANTIVAKLEHHDVEASGQIHNSLFVDGQHAGLSNRLMLEFAHIFNYDIDFAQDLQAGDRFTVIYDQIYKNGKKLRDGDILAAEFVNQGHRHRAVRFVESDGSVAYYTPQGQPLHRAFIRTPVDFTRISSGFSLARWHPILHRMRAHYGVDYAAPMGTPVHVTGDGRIAFIGRDGGYGNAIKVQHGKHYETIYGHMSRFRKGLGVGTRVHQGEVIGYVGMTGLATGPHLHYEFRVNGAPKNPMTVKLPRGLPMSPRELARFRKQEGPLVARIDSVDSSQYADSGPTIGTR